MTSTPQVIGPTVLSCVIPAWAWTARTFAAVVALNVPPISWQATSAIPGDLPIRLNQGGQAVDVEHMPGLVFCAFGEDGELYEGLLPGGYR